MSRSKVVTRNSINPLESLMNILPCDRPIKSIQLIESYESCPSNYVPLHKTLDTDSDADLFKENILFGKKNTRYLCISKTEGLPNFVLEKIRIIGIGENMANEGFISITHTSDSNQKARRKKQLVYKLSKTELVQECITDIIVLHKYSRQPPEGFQYLGELERVHICFKVGPPKSEVYDFTQQIENLRVQSNVYPSVNIVIINLDNENSMKLFGLQTNGEHYYESLQLSYQLPSSPASRPMPLRAAPLPPSLSVPSNTSTLSHYHKDFIGVPFVLNPRLNVPSFSMEIPKFENSSDALEYDFQLERQILCTTKSENRKSQSTNPFF